MEYIFLARRLSASYLIPSGNAASYLEMRAGNAASRYGFAVIRLDR